MSDIAKEQLVRAAIGLISEKGPDGFSVRDVAALAEVNHGLVHRHFASKTGLIEAAYERVVEELALATFLEPDGAFRASRLFAAMGERKELVNCLIWILRSGYLPKSLARVVPPLPPDSAAQSDALEQQQPIAAVIAAATLGWQLFKPLIAVALKAQPEAIEPGFGAVLDELQERLTILPEGVT